MGKKEKAWFQALIAVIFQNIWRYRNEACSNQKKEGLEKVRTRSIMLTNKYFNHRFADNSSPKPPNTLVRWKPPPRGQLKVNTDESFTNKGELGGAGFVVRQPNRAEIFAGTRCGQYNSLLKAEAMAVKEAPLFLKDKGFSNLQIETDSNILVPILNDQVPIPWILEAIIEDIKLLTYNF